MLLAITNRVKDLLEALNSIRRSLQGNRMRKAQGLLIVTLNGVKGLKSLLQVKADSPIKTFRFFVASSSE